MKNLMKKFLAWLDARAQQDAIYAEYLRNNKMTWGVQ